MDAVRDQRDRCRHAWGDGVARRDVERHEEVQRQVGRVVGREHEMRRLAEDEELGDAAGDRILVLAPRRAVAAMEDDEAIGDDPVHAGAGRAVARGLERQARPVEQHAAAGARGGDAAGKDVAEADEAGDLGRDRAGRDRKRRPFLEGAALVQDDHPVGEARGLFHVVSDEDDGHVEAAAELGDLAVEPLARRAVDGGEGLVEQQRARRAGERPGDGDALLLAARHLGGAPGLEAGEMDEGEDLAGAGGALGPRQVPEGGRDVAFRGHVREERVGLRHETDPPPVRRQEDAAVGVGPGLAIGGDAGADGMVEAGDRAQERRLSGARGADEGEDLAAPGAEAGGERDRRVGLGLDLERHQPRRRPIRRDMAKDSEIATSEMKSRTSDISAAERSSKACTRS
jgi:hypothetical protein